jgi:sigma-B regulation protein RsbU (phosphoserine phosphatase)
LIKLKSLQSRLLLFLILPVGLLLVVMGASAFFYARSLLFTQWREAAILKLQRAAHEVDMNLGQIKEAIRMFHAASGSQSSDSFHAWVLNYIRSRQGVVNVELSWNNSDEQGRAGNEAANPMMRNHGVMHRMPMGPAPRMRRFHSARIREITPPRFDTGSRHGTVSLVSDLIDESGQDVGRLEVLVDFSFIFRHVIESGWWQSTKAFLVDDSGQILICTDPARHGRLGEGGDPLELATLHALTTEPSGTILGPGHPPDEVSGYQGLHEAPWSLVMIAPGREILAPIVRLRLIFFVAGVGFIVIIIALIRLVTLRTTLAIKNVSDASLRLARGEFGRPLPVQSHDEVGELTRSFNAMSAQLKERMQMKEAMTLAMEVQQHLLPRGKPDFPGLDIAARSIYCDETGGDFYDFMENLDERGSRLAIVVGDGSGHGVSAALLMASVRAALRTRAAKPGTPAEILSEVNRLVGRDTGETGHFVTLFYLEIDAAKKTLRWVRAGHEPAWLIDPQSGGATQLKGEGMAVGVDLDSDYPENTRELLHSGQVLFIGTDGVADSRNPAGERFGTERVISLLLQWSSLSSDEIVGRILDALSEFRGAAKQEDDVTLVVIKAVA